MSVCTREQSPLLRIAKPGLLMRLVRLVERPCAISDRASTSLHEPPCTRRLAESPGLLNLFTAHVLTTGVCSPPQETLKRCLRARRGSNAARLARPWRWSASSVLTERYHERYWGLEREDGSRSSVSNKTTLPTRSRCPHEDNGCRGHREIGRYQPDCR